MFNFDNILCFRAFTELYIDVDQKRYRPCCQFDPHQGILYEGMIDFHKKIRDDNLKNQWSRGCENCKNAEINKTLSHRMFSANLPDQTIINDNKFILKHLELRLDATCNLACITCDSGSSSKWASEDRRMYGGPIFKNEQLDYNWIYDEKLWENVESLTLYGGEPFYSKKTKTLLFWLIEKNLSQNIKVTLYTNGSIVNDEIIKNLENFKSCTIGVSIDGIGENFEIIRWPAKWSEILFNFEKLKSIKNSSIYITYTVSVLNIFNIQQDYEYLKNNFSNNISFNFVVNPNYYNIKNLPDKFKKKLSIELIKEPVFKEVIKKINRNGDSAALKECFDRLKTLDRFRNTFSCGLFPENFVNFCLTIPHNVII